MKKNALYAQSGGVTAVINASACGVIQTARQFSDQIACLYAAKNGIDGVFNEQLINTFEETPENIAKLMHTPAGAFGTCRHKIQEHSGELEKIIELFRRYDIGYFFYNGGGDSQDTALKIALQSESQGYPVTCIGIPKTVDNDLPFTDTCPGFGSVAKYIAISTLEAGMDVASMAASSTKVFILEVMGRHAGWIAAASGLAGKDPTQPPHIILFPEIVFEEARFLTQVKKTVEAHGYCVIVASEGIKNTQGQFLSDSGLRDSFGHAQLGGVAPVLAQRIKKCLNFKNHWAVADYLQRSARHIASAVDVEQAFALGKAAVELACKGEKSIMPIIVRIQDEPYRWTIGQVPLANVANQEKMMPREFINEDGYSITETCRRYLLPLIQGEAYPPYVGGLPDYLRLASVNASAESPRRRPLNGII
jgi:6-phosphofructokinase 1